MIRALAIILLTLSLHAGTIINQNIYEKEDAVDIMLSFDSPYEGKIIQKKEAENRIFILENTTIEEKTTTKINSTIVQKLQLIPYKNTLFIELSGVDDFTVDASKTVDNYGLRLRITPQSTLADIAPLKAPTFETKKEDSISSAYLKVLLVMGLLIGFLYLFKKWLQQREIGTQNSWLFDKKNPQKKDSTITIKQQRAIDMKNRLALISYHDKEYLLLLGSSNLLLDTFEAQSNTDDFDTLLNQNKEQLDGFITRTKQSKLDAYKQKSSNIP